MRFLIGAAAAGAVFIASAVLVVAGAFSALDKYAIEHWMAELPHGESPLLSVRSLLWPRLGSPLHAFCNVWTYPASALVSGAVVAMCCIVLLRRGLPRAAVAWAAAWIVGNLIEVSGKLTLERPDLVVGGVHVRAFDHSFPSGHALRAVIVAGALLSLWRWLAVPAVLWAAIVLPALVIRAAHTPSDVIGGALLGTTAVFAVHAFVRVTLARRSAAPRIRAVALEDR